MALTHRLEVRSEPVGLLGPRRLHTGRESSPGADPGEQLSLLDRVADLHVDALDDTAGVGEHLVLHLHRLEHEQRRPGADLLVDPTRDRHDDARERRRDRDLSVGCARGIGGHRQIIAQVGASGPDS